MQVRNQPLLKIGFTAFFEQFLRAYEYVRLSQTSKPPPSNSLIDNSRTPFLKCVSLDFYFLLNLVVLFIVDETDVTYYLLPFIHGYI